MKRVLLLSLVLFFSGYVLGQVTIGRSGGRYDPAQIVSELRAGILKRGSLYSDLPVVKPRVNQVFKIDEDKFIFKYFESSEYAIAIYSKNGKLFAARERTGNKEIWYFCDMEIFSEFVKASHPAKLE